jgi:hypothetical protein
MARPRPAPPRLRLSSARLKRSNACGRNATGKPGPSSLTCNSSCFSLSAAVNLRQRDQTTDDRRQPGRAGLRIRAERQARRLAMRVPIRTPIPSSKQTLAPRLFPNGAPFRRRSDQSKNHVAVRSRIVVVALPLAVALAGCRGAAKTAGVARSQAAAGARDRPRPRGRARCLLRIADC